MPIKNKSLYPRNWKEISNRIRFGRAKSKCELCDAEHDKPHWKTGSRVVLTVHHIDGDKNNNSEYNLIALCQRCHLRLDLEKHIKNRQKNKINKQQLFLLED